MEHTVAAIVNPAAGRARGARLRDLALAELGRLFPGLEVQTTQSPGHATQLARALRNCSLLIAVGGDGTVREIADGLVGEGMPVTATTIAVVPVGSGNDFNRTLGIPADVRAACRIALEGTDRAVDHVRLVAQAPDRPVEAGFVNAAGWGFDALVASRARESKYLRGLALYGSAVLRAVRDYDCPRVRVRTGEREWEQRVLLVAAANGRCYGGGMRMAPDAEPDDGLLDVCVIDELGRLKVIRHLPSFVRGTHGSIPEVSFYRASTIELEFLDPVPVQLDGDVMDWGHLRRFRVKAHQRALRFRVPAV